MKEGKAMFETEAHMFAEAIKALANNESALDNMECYLSHHFDVWMEKYANTPAWIARELKEFSTIE